MMHDQRACVELQLQFHSCMPFLQATSTVEIDLNEKGDEDCSMSTTQRGSTNIETNLAMYFIWHITPQNKDSILTLKEASMHHLEHSSTSHINRAMPQLLLVSHMLEFKKFLAIWFAAIIIVSALFIGWAEQSSRPNEATEVEGSHFSVVWNGFKPTYSNQYPDYYICINNLKDESLRMYIQLKIENYENTSFYFMIDQYSGPPTGWYVGSQNFGLIMITDPIKSFEYSNINRTKPAAIPQGSLHESVELAVKAYYDSSYTQFYSQANFTVNFHFVDVTATVWSKVVYNNFDDGTAQGWSSGQVHWWQYYRSWP
jgi:hypothetical protein